MDFPFVWDELDLLVTYGSDVPLAKSLILQEANGYLQSFMDN